MALHIVPSLVGRLSLGKHAVLPALGNLVCRRPSGTQPRIRPQIHKHSHGIALKSYRQPSAAMTRCAYSGELSEPTNRINAHEISKTTPPRRESRRLRLPPEHKSKPRARPVQRAQRPPWAANNFLRLPSRLLVMKKISDIICLTAAGLLEMIGLLRHIHV